MSRLTGRRLTDLALPASAPIETYIDETVAVLADLLEETPAEELLEVVIAEALVEAAVSTLGHRVTPLL